MDETQAMPQRLDLKVWKKLLPFFKPYYGIMAVNVFFQFAEAGIAVIMPLFLSYAIKNFVEAGSIEGLWQYTALYLGAVLLSCACTILFSRLCMVLEMRLGCALKRATFVHLQKLPLSYFSTTPVGYILARVMSDTNRIASLISWGFIDIFWGIAYVFGAFFSMFRVNATLALLVLAMIFPVILITFYMQGKIIAANRDARTANAKVTGAYNEGITGAKTTKSLVIEDLLSQEFSVLTKDMYRHSMRAQRLNAMFLPLVGVFSTTALALVLSRGGYMVMDNAIDFGTMSLFFSYALVLLDPIQQMARVFAESVAAQVNIERVVGLIEEDCTITDSPAVTEKYGDSFTPKTENWEPIKGDIEFRNVWFKYPDGDENILEDFSLKIPAGTNVAIVGETGAGKSTLVNLACRFYEPTEGQILIDGVDYRERSQLWLHSSLGYVLQNPHLFSGTVMDNIKYGRLEATEEDVRRAAQLVSADTVIDKLEKGYQTDVGEGGDRLSTGEKQLISFARAVLSDPPIFVLDEATSSIDTETELLIQNAISHILSGRTSFLIAHRLSTVRQADLILVVEDGKIIESGTHRELIRHGGHYAALYRAMAINEKSSNQ